MTQFPIYSFLKGLGLEQYSGVFIQNEYKDLPDLIGITIDELANLGICKVGPKRKFENALKNLSPIYSGESKIPVC